LNRLNPRAVDRVPSNPARDDIFLETWLVILMVFQRRGGNVLTGVRSTPAPLKNQRGLFRARCYKDVTPLGFRIPGYWTVKSLIDHGLRASDFGFLNSGFLRASGLRASGFVGFL
jgi:hypothetical protein